MRITPRDPLDHYEELDWTIAPWMFFLTRPTPYRDGTFANCRIYDTRSKTLGLWSDSLSSNYEASHRFLIDALPPQQIFDEWIEALRTLELVPSLSNGEGRIYTLGNRESLDQLLALAETRPAGFLDELIDMKRKEVNLYWAQRTVYEQSGWPNYLQSETLIERKIKWNRELLSRSAEEQSTYYRMLAGNNAV